MKWSRGPPIGRGSTATVSTAVIYPEGEILAVKSVELTRRSLLQNEQRIHSTIRCPYIIEYKGADVTVENGKPMYNIFTELASLGSLAGSTAKSSQKLSLYALSILKGLEYLHCNGIVHCDIKPSNVLVTAEGCVKIADLGCARLADDVAGRIAGTPVYMAPEVARGEQQGYPADVWALGCTVIEMATGKAPWGFVSDPVSAMYRIGFSGQVPEIPEFLCDEAKDFIGKCLRLDPEQRWSVNQLLLHPFVSVANPDLLTELQTGHGFCTVSPTSVLNSDLCDPEWNNFCSPTCDDEEDQNRVFKSATERIRILNGPGFAIDGLPGSDLDDDDCWVTVRSCNVGKACFSNRVELESPFFDMGNFDVSFITYFGDDYCNIIDTNCSTSTTTIVSGNAVNGAGEFSRINFWQFDSDVNGIQIPSINICKTDYFGCVALFTSQIPNACIENQTWYNHMRLTITEMVANFPYYLILLLLLFFFYSQSIISTLNFSKNTKKRKQDLVS